jgi:MFS family permease
VKSRRSLIALDWANFSMADVETGVGPFVSVFLASSFHWSPAQVGLVLSAQNIASVLAQTPAGALVDWSRHKRWLLVFAALVIAAGCIVIVHAPSVPVQMANQIAIGMAVTLVSPTIAAISLGIVGKSELPRRVGRNATFSHAGNVVSAGLAGYAGYLAGQSWIFYLSAMSGLIAIGWALLIRQEDIDNTAARASDETRSPASVGDLVRDKRLLTFLAVVILFHMANSPMLPLAGQEIAKQAGKASSIYMTGCIVLSQMAMVAVSYRAGKLAGSLGRKPVYVAGFSVLALRGIAFSMAHQPSAIIGIEILDGIGTAISGIVTIVTAADLAKGTGRFNLLQGAIQTTVSGGAFLGNLCAGFVAKSYGYPAAFLLLSSVALAGLAFYSAFMPETNDARTTESELG